MVKTTLTFLCFFIVILVNSQDKESDDALDHNIQMSFQLSQSFDYGIVEGDRYLFPEFKKTIFFINDSTRFNGISNIDLFKNQVIYKKNDSLFILPSYSVESLQIGSKKFLSIGDVFYELLAEKNNISILEKNWKVILDRQDGDGYLKDLPERFSDIRSKQFIFNKESSEFIEFPRTRKSLISYLNKEYNLEKKYLKKWLKENDFDFSSKNSLESLLDLILHNKS